MALVGTVTTSAAENLSGKTNVIVEDEILTARVPYPDLTSLDVGDSKTFTPIIDQLSGKRPLDTAVIEALPNGASFFGSQPHGKSRWTVTGKIMGTEPDGTEKDYFIKISSGEHGGVILKGEFEAAKQIYKLVPQLIPQPFAYGRFRDSLTYFYLSEFVHMTLGKKPNAEELASGLAELHLKSRSPTGQFGFHVTTCDGKMPHVVEWEDDWAVFFAKLLRNIVNIDGAANKPWPEMERAAEQVITKVVPRLLGDLRQQDGSPIKPCLLHGDVWEPNTGCRSGPQEKLVLFDVGSYYAHNEMEMGQWRAPFCQYLATDFEEFTSAYKRHYPFAEPVGEWEDRNRLYSLKGTLNYSAGHEGVARESAYNNMCYLCERYAPIDGIDKYDPQKDPMVTGYRITPDFEKKDDIDN